MSLIKRRPPFRLVEQVKATHRGSETIYIIQRKILFIFWVYEDSRWEYAEASKLLDRYIANWGAVKTSRVIE
jgi:hypothetical protein